MPHHRLWHLVFRQPHESRYGGVTCCLCLLVAPNIACVRAAPLPPPPPLTASGDFVLPPALPLVVHLSGTDGVQMRAPGTLEFMPPEAFLGNEQGGTVSDSSDSSSDDEQGTSAASAAERIEAKRRRALQRRLKRSIRKNRQQEADMAESKRSSRNKASVVAYDDSAAPLLDRAMPGVSLRRVEEICFCCPQGKKDCHTGTCPSILLLFHTNSLFRV